MPKKLLLAEDSLTIRKVFELALSRSDIAITAVDNGEDAVRLAGEIFPDLVVADLTLPGKNGFAVAAELRAMEKTEKIPVLILSGTLVPLDEARFKASGARGVLFKPFESRELLENIERLLREGTAAPESPKTQEAPAVDERWDFSDVMDEVEAEAGKSAAPAPAAREALLPGALLPGGPSTSSTFNEFDVSIDEIEGGARDLSAEPPPPVPAPKVEHMESDLPMDSPPPVTDLSPALDEVEEIEEIEHLEDLEVPLPPAAAVLTETPASLRILPAATAQPAVEEPVPEPPSVAEPFVLEPAVEESHPAPPASLIAPPDAGSRPGDAELREFFAGRAEEIFRTVASEAVEKVMWEMTDRLAAEFSAKLRESVEAVAWEVIPSTAEALIREEIARIRGKAGKTSP
ncbi:MAG: response regulator [Candidatus Deferrimicrobium sp.]|nr:response regulator [Candidatus Deferrimicrobium sp.]